MLFEGASRAGFRPLRPEIKAKEPTAIATSATIRHASRGQCGNALYTSFRGWECLNQFNNKIRSNSVAVDYKSNSGLTDRSILSLCCIKLSRPLAIA